MAVANGVPYAPITRKVRDLRTGKDTPFFTYPYVTYSQSNGLFNPSTVKTYLIYAQPTSIFGTIRYVTGAVLDENGKFKPLKENEAFELDPTTRELTKISNGANKYIFGDAARQELSRSEPDSLGQLAISKSKEVLLRSNRSLTAQQVNQAYTFSPIRDLRTAAAQTDTEDPLPPTGTPPDQASSSDSVADGQQQQEEPGLNISILDINSIQNAVDFKLDEDLKYPRNIGSNGQDYIKFEILKYQGKKFDEKTLISSGGFNLSESELEKIRKGTIILGIQPRITDTNSVDWVRDTMSAYEMIGQVAGAQILNGADPATTIQNAITTAFKDDGTKQAIIAELAKAAVRSQNSLFTRVTGAIINPNVELLFQGPTLRQFPFSFTLTPRGDDEAKQTKKIIQAFKRASAVQVTTSQLFLKTPHVFKITYMTPGKDGKPTIHPSLNRIKICALQSMSVDYTPAGTYMTYNDDDGDHPMTSYSVQLNFSELEPVYDIDYVEAKIGPNEIGY